MQQRTWIGLSRITKTREEIERATQLAFERKREGYSLGALESVIDDILHDEKLSRAIAAYVDFTDEGEKRPLSWLPVGISAAFATFCLWMVYVLFTLVEPETSWFSAVALVLLQGLLLKFAQRGVRESLMSSADRFNDASFPTRFHPFPNPNFSFAPVRNRRLRTLMKETAVQISSGADPDSLERELADVNLTPRAAHFIVKLARLRASTRDFFPPYESRWLAYGLSAVFVITCVVFIGRAGDKIPEGFQNYAAVIAGCLGASLSRRRRTPVSPPAAE